MKKLLWSFAIIMLTAGCFGNKADNSDKTNNQNNDNGNTVDTKGLNAEYKELVAEMDAAIEKGYEYKHLFQNFKRSGSYIHVGEPGSVIFSVGNDDDKHFQVMKSADYMAINEMQITDMLKTNHDTLKKQLLAYSTNGTYNFNANDWKVNDITMEDSNGATIITVTTVLTSMSNSTPHVETYTISDGLIEKYELVSAANNGQPQIWNFEFLSKGPIDSAAIKAIYDDVKENADRF